MRRGIINSVAALVIALGGAVLSTERVQAQTEVDTGVCCASSSCSCCGSTSAACGGSCSCK
jgi:hypothetical protein